MSPRPPDFNRLFAAGARHDFSHFRAGCVVTVRIAQGTDLRLPSGRLIASEPWFLPEPAADYAFVQQVPPGTYPVQLIIADFHDPGNPQDNNEFCEVAAARLVVRDEPVAEWRMGLQPGMDDADLAEDEFYGYPVDGGIGAFSSPEFVKAVQDNDGFEALTDASMDLGMPDEVGEYVQPQTGTNVVMFSSGGGDGRYGTWVGYTAAGEIACFVTDFMTLTNDDDDGDEEDDQNRGPDPQDAKPAPSYREPEPAVPVYQLRGPASRAMGAQMLVGQTLRRQSLTSPYGMCTLVYQDDGNLVLYRYDREWALWASNTQGAPVGECVLQEDGNLVIYNREGRAVWATNTNGRPAARLSVRDDGYAVLETVSGEVLWATDPVAAAAIEPVQARGKVAGIPSRAASPKRVTPGVQGTPVKPGIPARPATAARPAVPRKPPSEFK